MTKIEKSDHFKIEYEFERMKPDRWGSKYRQNDVNAYDTSHDDYFYVYTILHS